MPLRLVIDLEPQPLKRALEPGEYVVGSAPDADIRLGHPTVSRRHARLSVAGEVATLEDLDSSNGTLVDSRRIRGAVELPLNSTFTFGSVRAHLEEVREGDLRPALAIDPPPAQPPTAAPKPEAGPHHTTLSAGTLEDFAFHHLPALLESLARGPKGPDMAQEVGAMLYGALPCLGVEIHRIDAGRRVPWYVAHAQDESPEEAAPVERTLGDLTLRATFFPAGLARAYAPLLDSALLLVDLARRRSPGTPKAPRPKIEPPPLPRPATLDPGVRHIYSQAAQVARGQVGVLIQGESGTGKEVLARYLHAASEHPSEAFVALNCAALPRDLLELELFGIERGVATGVDARPGKFELAHGGTLFLDELGDMALETQAKILRVLQEGEVYRLGAKQPRQAQARILAATNRDITGMVEAGTFRGDLYHRIARWVVTLPPLRRRTADIPNLAIHFLVEEAERRGIALAGISQSAVDALLAYPWPGNIRELQGEIARAALFLTDGELLESSHLGEGLTKVLDRPETLREILERVEREEIEKALRRCGDHTAQAAEWLGIGRSTLYRRMKALGLEAPKP